MAVLGMVSQLHRDCRVDPRLLAAFRALAGEQAEVSIALRCEEMLSRCTPLLQVCGLKAARHCCR